MNQTPRVFLEATACLLPWAHFERQVGSRPLAQAKVEDEDIEDARGCPPILSFVQGPELCGELAFKMRSGW